MPSSDPAQPETKSRPTTTHRGAIIARMFGSNKRLEGKLRDHGRQAKEEVLEAEQTRMAITHGRDRLEHGNRVGGLSASVPLGG
jgi:hypothetical protein